LSAVRRPPSAVPVAEPNRHHIAHIQLIEPDDVPCFASLGVAANGQTNWAQRQPQIDEFTAPLLGPELQYRSAICTGADRCAVRRIDPEHRDNAPSLPAQQLSLPVAVTAFTAGSAYVNHDNDGGSISRGMRADLAVLERNIFDTRSGLPADCACDPHHRLRHRRLRSLSIHPICR